MVNKTKITEEIGAKIREMAKKGMNPTAMGKIVGLTKDTVKGYCDKNNISYGVRTHTNVLAKEILFQELLPNAKHLKELQKLVGIGNEQANEWAPLSYPDYPRPRLKFKIRMDEISLPTRY